MAEDHDDEAVAALMREIQSFLIGRNPSIRARAVRALLNNLLLMESENIADFDCLLDDTVRKMRAEARKDFDDSGCSNKGPRLVVVH